MDYKRLLLCVVVLFTAHAVESRVLVDSIDDLQDHGTFLQLNGLKFSINGVMDDQEEYCTNGTCSVEIQLPLETEEMIDALAQNATMMQEKSDWLQSLNRYKATPRDPKPGIVKHRQKRCWISCHKTVTQVDPYAEDRFLLEKERTKMETIQYCLNNCAKEWSQWTSCTEQCGSGTQTRNRELIEPVGCAEKWIDYEFPENFTCPFKPDEKRSCNEGCPNGGEPSTPGCNCYDGWGGTCCERKLYCDFPGQPINGRTIQNVSPSPVGSIVMYDCDEGYVLNGATYSLCEQTQQWSSQVPTCNKIVCPQPALTTNLTVLNVQESYDFGETIHYKCAPGFVLQGPELQKCQDSSDGSGRWSLYTPHCTAIECPAPTQADIPNGYVTGVDYTYQASITFQCYSGYELVGLSSLTCTKHGRWNGFYPTCNEISCTPPYPPVDGDMQIFGTNTVVFSCQEGYKLSDETERVAVCQDDGQWSISTPTCQAIDCDGSEIDQVANGFVNGGVYRFPFSVKFGCYPGYVLQGLDEISCQENGEWSGDAPTCTPCLVNTYMDEWSIGGVCKECPANTHTTTPGSTNRQQCICDDGFQGPNGGPCEEVKCTRPNVPINGARGKCGVNVGQQCSFTCNPGYIPSAGASVIECLSNGEWSNQAFSCTACSADTYNPTDEPNICLPCPDHMSTEGLTGQVLEGCLCSPGWQGEPGGPCTDVNECETLTGGLACEDECVNSPGSYHCTCTRPGTVLNADGLSCDVEDSCRELTRADAPSNGALVCTHNEQQSSRFCAARCNKGFEFAGDTLNSYETCDASTNFDWPFESLMVSPGLNPADARITDCVPEFMPGYQLNAEVFYLSAACEDLTPEQQTEVKEAFIGVLNDGVVCERSALSCSIENVRIICGARKKRDANGSILESVDFNFNVSFANVANMMSSPDCDSYVCPMFHIKPELCDRYCFSVMKNYAKAVMKYAEMKLAKLTPNLERIRFTVFDRNFEPENVVINDKSSKCPRPGQEFVPATNNKESYCVSCKGGQYLNGSGVCAACPAGTHQLRPEQMSCPQCPSGSYSEAGWSYCLTCDDGFYGENCSHQCSCVHGKCNSENGECDCEPGWEGPDCSVDIDRCQFMICPPGQTCQDRHPPEDGFDCV